MSHKFKGEQKQTSKYFRHHGVFESHSGRHSNNAFACVFISPLLVFIPFFIPAQTMIVKSSFVLHPYLRMTVICVEPPSSHVFSENILLSLLSWQPTLKVFLICVAGFALIFFLLCRFFYGTAQRLDRHLRDGKLYRPWCIAFLFSSVN